MTVIIDDSVDGIYLFASKLSWSQLALLHAFQILFQYLPAEMPADRVFRMKKTKLSSLNNTQRAVLSRIWQSVCSLCSSMFIMISPPYFVSLLLAAHLVTSAAMNYSVDDLDPLFKYSGAWEINTKNLNISTGENMDKDGGHHLAESPELSATITYTCAYLLKVNNRSTLLIIKSSQPIPFPPFF